nr:PREDICTED: uncharacterized protein LOC103314207 isoform X1 [Tribolium castaneum]|eukprot:XP_015838770.1 PREDICTED: uncharacterized protein LOC103314207 isoform X1 [Tribolium castaneum]
MCVSVVVLFRPEQALIVILPLIDAVVTSPTTSPNRSTIACGRLISHLSNKCVDRARFFRTFSK